MNYKEALAKAILEGVRIRCVKWPKDLYAYFDPAYANFRVTLHGTGCKWEPSSIEILPKLEFEIYEEPKLQTYPKPKIEPEGHIRGLLMRLIGRSDESEPEYNEYVHALVWFNDLVKNSQTKQQSKPEKCEECTREYWEIKFQIVWGGEMPINSIRRHSNFCPKCGHKIERSQ